MNRKMTRLAFGGWCGGFGGERVGDRPRGAGVGREAGEGEGAEPAAGAGEPFAARDRQEHGRLGRRVASSTTPATCAYREPALRRYSQFTYRKSADANSAWNSAAHAVLRVAGLPPGTSRPRSRSPLGRLAAQRQPVRPRRRGRRRPACFSAEQPRRGVLRLLEHERVVHQEQRLRGDRADVPPAGHHARVGEVEHLEQLRQRVAEHRQVDAAARVGVLVAVVGREARRERRPAARRRRACR